MVFLLEPRARYRRECDSRRQISASRAHGHSPPEMHRHTSTGYVPGPVACSILIEPKGDRPGSHPVKHTLSVRNETATITFILARRFSEKKSDPCALPVNGSK